METKKKKSIECDRKKETIWTNQANFFPINIQSKNLSEANNSRLKFKIMNCYPNLSTNQRH